MKTVTRRELAKSIAVKFKLTTDVSRAVVEELLVQMATQLADGNRIEFRGFGVLKPCIRKQKIGRNPQDHTAGDYIIPERKTVRFYIGKDLDAVLNP